MQRQIGLFVEGDTERGEARRKTLPQFFGRWLNSQMPPDRRVGIYPVKFHGISSYLDDLAQKVSLCLEERRVNYVIGLVDLYGIPADRIDLSLCGTVGAKIAKARESINRLIPPPFRRRFVQHFAVHEVEAWLLAYPDEWPANMRQQIKRRKPEQVNFNEPPAKFLDRLHGGKYKKTVVAMNKFPRIDPQIAIDSCPNLRLLTDDLLRIAQWLISQ